MPQIIVEVLAKVYRVVERAPGLSGALRVRGQLSWVKYRDGQII